MLLLPIILLVVLALAVSTEIKNIPFVVLDESRSVSSERFISKLSGNNHFYLSNIVYNKQDIDAVFKKGDVKLIITIPYDFEVGIVRSSGTVVQSVIDAADPNEAVIIENYFQSVVTAFVEEQHTTMPINRATITLEMKMLYNPQMDGTYSIVPGIIGLILMLICALMTSISIVREKETGTMEILLVSPLKPKTIMLAKSIPYLTIAFLNMVFILIVSYFLLGVPINGCLLTISMLSIVYAFSALALGLLVSTIAKTQQMAMLIAGVGLMLPTMLLSGLIFPVESMPMLLRGLSCILPVRWYVDALKIVMIKGLPFGAIWFQFTVLVAMCFLLMVISIKKFKKRL